MESEADSFRAKVREGYLERAKRHPRRIVVVDASVSVESIHERILAEAVETIAG
jgi:dTMP kinase